MLLNETKPPNDLQELEEQTRKRSGFNRNAFSLRKLVIVSNLLGLGIAIIVLSRGAVYGLAIMSFFIAPILVFLFIAFAELKGLLLGRSEKPLASQRSNAKTRFAI